MRPRVGEKAWASMGSSQWEMAKETVRLMAPKVKTREPEKIDLKAQHPGQQGGPVQEEPSQADGFEETGPLPDPARALDDLAVLGGLSVQGMLDVLAARSTRSRFSCRPGDRWRQWKG